MTTHTNIAIVEGELYIYNVLKLINVKGKTSDKTPKIGKYTPTTIFFGDLAYPIIATTAGIATIPQLSRKHFVKPKVDVHLEAVNEYWKNRPITECDYLDDFVKGFKAGNNVKESEFTREDMMQAIKFGASYIDSSIEWTVESLNENAEIFINSLQPLSLPASITTDENYNVISVCWK